MRLSSIEEFVAQTRARILHADARLVLIDPDLAPFVVPEPGDPPMHGWEDLQPGAGHAPAADWVRSEEQPSELQSLMRNSYAVICLKQKTSPTHRKKTIA